MHYSELLCFHYLELLIGNNKKFININIAQNLPLLRCLHDFELGVYIHIRIISIS